MKFLYSLGLVLILVGGFYLLAGPPNRVAEPTSTEEPSLVVEELPINEGVEPKSEMSEVEPGDTAPPEESRDIGMEFPIPDSEEVLTNKTFSLEGFNYGYDQTELRVSEGDVVTINLSVSEGFHDWVLDEFDAATEKIRPGGLTSVTFTADSKGTYEFYCSVGSHRALGMVGTLVVE